MKRGKENQQQEKEEEKNRNKGDDSRKIKKVLVLMTQVYQESTGF